MPRAYCQQCKKHVNATPSGTGIIGGVKIEDALPGGMDVYLPIQNRSQTHYCPICGSSVLTEEQLERMDSSSATNVLGRNIMFLGIGIFALMWYSIGYVSGNWGDGFIIGLFMGGIIFLFGLFL